MEAAHGRSGRGPRDAPERGEVGSWRSGLSTRAHTHRPMRIARLAVFGLAVLVAVAWAGPRGGATAAASPRTHAVTTRTVTVADRLIVAGAAAGVAPGDGHSADVGGVALPAAPRASSARASAPAIATLDAGADFTMVGVMCDLPAADGAVSVRVRTSRDGRRWSSWYESPLEVASDGDAAPRAFVDAMWTGLARYVQVRARADDAGAPVVLDRVGLMTIDTRSGDVAGDGTKAPLRPSAAPLAGIALAPPASAAGSQPAWITRAGWGADESLRIGTPVTAPVKMAFVHHTAGANTYTQADAPALGPWHLRVPHQGPRLERHRLQLPRRPLRHDLRGPRRRRPARAWWARRCSASTRAALGSR